MADDEKQTETRVARTAGVAGTLHVGELEITPEGTELTREQWDEVAAAAVQNHVIVRLDEEFPPRPELMKADADANTEKPETGVEETEQTSGPEQGPAVDQQTPTPAAGRRGRTGG